MKRLLNRKKAIYKVSWCIFIAYICLMLWEVFIGPYRSFGGIRRYNLYPFKTILDFYYNNDKYGFNVIFINLIANIVMFIPLGFFLPIFSNKFRKHNKVLFLYVLIAASTEVIQIVLNVGIFDVDDIILNTAGCMLGYYIYRLIAKKLSV